MSKANFSDEFKRDAVSQITERGCPVSEVSARLGVSTHSLYAWKKKFRSRQVQVMKTRPQRSGDLKGNWCA